MAVIPKTVKAYRIFDEEGRAAGRFVDLRPDELDPGELTVRVAYSSVNYKDALAATGGKIIRRFPCVGGIDLAGTVVASSSPAYQAGEQVLATCCGLGENVDGGYAQLCRFPAAWATPLPAGLDAFEAMALGTAGLTAAFALERMERLGLRPSAGPVLVTGATGGVGSLAVDILSGAGYRVTALTGKAPEADYLRRLGAAEVLDRGSLDFSRVKPLDKAVWAGAVDNLGGNVLSWLLSRMRPGGTAASIGLAASPSFQATVMPFILRGVSLLGIDSLLLSPGDRARLWGRLGGELKPRHLREIAAEVPFAELPGVFARMLDSRVRGRTVVRIS
ncbi:MAG: quinone oxidoreductase [Elusimicrobia bacterium GWA2_69_24]|nr:MAG: quinone oxidoreductase [Elusimicrobia bacterium GWA2_69_24]HBL18544.1 oxidoreductase [Elusimicrobiota bacterium]